MTKLSMFAMIGGASLLVVLPVSLQWSQKNVALSLDTADARIGRPGTALSVAGVHRRAYRRAARAAVYGGAIGAVGYGAYYGGYGYPAYSAPYYGTGYGYGSYYGGYGYPGYYSTAPYNPGPSFGFGWRY